MEELRKVLNEVFNDEIIKAVISNKANKEVKYNKIVINIKETNKGKFYQLEKFTDKQVFHENIKVENISDKIYECLNENYKQLSAWSCNFTYDMKISKKGKIFLGKKKCDNSKNINKGHNKEKNYILKEGMIIEPLIDLGVFTKEGKIVNSKYDKYKQINRFIEIIDDEIRKNNYNDLTILDFGCGKSYLTFVLYYYFVKIKNINVKMIGLDLKEDVIKKCNEIAQRYNYENLHFELGDINGFKYNNKVDMVITLHACDTATDYALYNAVKWNSNMIFSVPCCQHEFNSQIKTNDLSILTKYGIVQERISALMTDSVRANLLECAG
ncbi:SAM-dependent methyltransferase, partial [uncultured Clostridium sp.]